MFASPRSILRRIFRSELLLRIPLLYEVGLHDRSGSIAHARWTSVLALLCLLASGSASSLPFDPARLVYEEDFDAESSYPTTPEIDLLGFGGGTGVTFLPGGSEVPGGPTLNGSQAIATVNSTVDPTKSFVIDHAAFGSGMFGVRAGFAGLVGPNSVPEATIASVVVEFATATPVELLVRATVILQVLDPSPGGLIGVFRLEEFDRGSGSTIIQGDVALSPANVQSIAAGAAFVVDLEVDPDTSSATASLDLNGVEVAFISPQTLTLLSAGVDAIETNVAMSAVLGANSQVAIDPVEIYGDPPALARTFTVDTLVDAADVSAGDGVCATSSAACSLRAAVGEANASPTHDTIILPAGTYVLNGFPSALSITEDLTIEGDDRANTIVDGNGLHRVFEIGPAASDITAEVFDVTIRNGLADGSTTRRGGGILNHGDLRLTRSRVTGNHARQGGGIMSFGRLTLDDCVVDENHVSELSGGTGSPRGAGVSSGTFDVATPVEILGIRNSAIVSNTATPVTESSGVELSRTIDARIDNSTVSVGSGMGVDSFESSLELRHATLVAPATALRTVDSKVGFINAAIQGMPACAQSAAQTGYFGNNASSDLSCGFVGPGDVTNIGLGLAPLAAIGTSLGHVPLLASPLVDAAGTPECLPEDQVHTPRPIDGDGNGSAECDIGAIEAPEPGFLVGLGMGLVGMTAIPRRRLRHA